MSHCKFLIIGEMSPYYFTGEEAAASFPRRVQMEVTGLASWRCFGLACRLGFAGGGASCRAAGARQQSDKSCGFVPGFCSAFPEVLKASTEF